MYKFTAIFMLIIVSGCVETSIRKIPQSSERIKADSGFSEKTSAEKPLTVNVPEPAGKLAFREAVRLTLMKNPGLKAYSYKIRAAEAKKLQSGLWVNPEISYEAEEFGGTGEFSGTDAAEQTIMLSQLIPLGGKLEKSRDVAGFDLRLAGMDYRAKRLDVLSELSKTYIELLFIQEKEQLAQELIDTAEEVIQSVDKRVQAGKDAPLDLSKAKIGLAEAKIEYLEALKLVDFYRKKLGSFWGNPGPKFEIAGGNLDEVSEIQDIEKLTALLSDNPDVARWAIEVQKRNAQKELADSKAVPDVTIAGGYKRLGEANENAYVIGFSIPLPVFDRNQGNRLAARENIRAAKNQRQAEYLDARNELIRLHSELESIYDKLEIYEDEILPLAENIFSASRSSYDQGKIDYLTLLDSQVMYFKSRNGYIDTLAQYHILRIQLQRLIGRDVSI